MLTKGLKHLWFGYAALIFALNMLFWGPLYLLIGGIFREKAARLLIANSHYVVSRTIRYPLLIFLRSHDRQVFKKKQAYVIVNNHQSSLDFLLSATGCPILYKFLVKKAVLKIPLFGVSVRLFSIMVDRKSAASRKASMQRMADALQAGTSIFLYPEGTRNRTNQVLKKFYDGAFRLAIETKTPLIVGTIVGANRLLSPKRPYQLRPGWVDLYWEAPIDTQQMTLEDLPKLKQTVRDIMLVRLNQK